MITVEGFTEIQRDLADRIWALDSQGEVDDFIRSLPTKWMRKQALVVYDMLVAAYIDAHVAEMPQFPEVEILVDKFRG